MKDLERRVQAIEDKLGITKEKEDLMVSKALALTKEIDIITELFRSLKEIGPNRIKELNEDLLHYTARLKGLIE